MRLFNRTKTVEKIQIIDFKKLKPADLMPLYSVTKSEIMESMLFATVDGKILLNKHNLGSEAVKIAFDVIIKQPKSKLEELEKVYSLKYPNVNNVEDIQKIQNNTERFEALVLCLIPAEYKRREFEKAYYEK